MDLKLSSDPYENFTLYQQKINEEYINMVDEYNIQYWMVPKHYRPAGGPQGNYPDPD